ncbi:MAG: helix-turn-helix domain-containing protein [Campylobacterota bacterium]|nr:helix-turn-helix domain-containing protein [Campylobacterota bacterium]
MKTIIELLNEIAQSVSEQTKSKDTGWLTPKSLEDEYGFKEATISKYRITGKIPFYKIGSKFIRYKRSEIDEWIEKHKVKGENNG